MKSGLGQPGCASCLIGVLIRRGSVLALAPASLVLAQAAQAAESAATSDAAAAVSPVGLGVGIALGLGFVVLALLVVTTVLRRSERLRAEAAELRQRQALSAALGRLLDVWQWHTDASHRLVSIKPPCGEGPASTDAQGTSALVWEHFCAVDADSQAAWRRSLESHQPCPEVRVEMAAAAGGVRLGWLRAMPLHGASGEFLGHVGTVREQAAPPAAAAASAKPSAPSASEQDAESFSYTVSHDLRAPVRVVEGFTKIVKEDYGRLLDRVGNDHLDRVLGAAARMNSMIDALLALSQLSSKPVSRQPVNLSQLAGFVVDDLRRQWPQHAVTVHIEPAMHVQGDPTLLRVMLENLLGNAWKYTTKCATPQVWFERCTDSAAPRFSVRDNGAGFDMRYADRLFGVFQRLHSASDFQGTGVGLASVRRIVQRHGGDVWAEAEVGRGANFYFSIGSPSA
jgi:signal transduction histidine kinase/heme exporter protein D